MYSMRITSIGATARIPDLDPAQSLTATVIGEKRTSCTMSSIKIFHNHIVFVELFARNQCHPSKLKFSSNCLRVFFEESCSFSDNK
ncbi:hypothetical protein NECAME_08202 [Necator americanus]|uniref:Uncharacterized protein n=1 Tax=Necator americanus TaxID=51031 RepID=W2TK98_NECAM|nr:hypothetical protein NECAME_08202 [Necator americanus]ETN82049.1 hypothetical protein NECAME_08202 [Necator americanus]